MQIEGHSTVFEDLLEAYDLLQRMAGVRLAEVELDGLEDLQGKLLVASNQPEILPVEREKRRPNLHGAHGEQDIVHQSGNSRPLSGFPPVDFR